MTELIEIDSYPVKDVLSKLLQDKSTGKNIIYATDYYSAYGCGEKTEISVDALRSFGSIDIQPRVKKAQADQTERTRAKAEVFTPTWIVKRMNDHCDSVWQATPNADDWQKYVQLRILEITCGEAPFLVTRYDTTTGEPIPISERTGMLDRKLKAIQTDTEEEWLKWAVKAFESTYGYEFQGDNLLIARINLLVTFCEYLQDRWGRAATDKEITEITNIITWNLWQMDGLSDTAPLGEQGEDFHQLSLFGDDNSGDLEADDCKIYNHRSRVSLLFRDIKEGKSNMKFDFVIGNPPYQEERVGTSDASVYHLFMDAAYSISDKVELITPAKFLFNAGDTPSSWNTKMLNDSHLKVLMYESDAKKVFDKVSFEGGVAITFRDATKHFGAIGVFTAYEALNSILLKVKAKLNESLTDIMVLQNKFDLQKLYDKYPETQSKIGSKGKESRLTTSIFTTVDIFSENESDFDNPVRILGLISAKRVYRFMDSSVLKSHDSLYKYKVIMPKSNGASGTLGEEAARIISKPVLGMPKDGYTQSFIGIGAFDTQEEASALFKYVKTKFARCMLAALKVTQDNNPETWKYVPLQDFTENSDIDWTQPIPAIDRQLYAKYGLSPEEIDFIETHVKEME